MQGWLATFERDGLIVRDGRTSLSLEYTVTTNRFATTRPASGCGKRQIRPAWCQATTRKCCAVRSAGSGNDIPAATPDRRYSITASLRRSPGMTAGMPGG
jgi:hypothetical protein